MSVVPAFTFSNNLGAHLGALTAELIPNAPGVVGARGLIGVAVEAATEADVGVVGLSGAHVFGVA